MKNQIMRSLAVFIAGCKGELDEDIQDLQKIANYIINDEIELAYKHFSSLDTYVRDIIPMDVYNYIWTNRCGFGKTKSIKLSVKTKNGNVLHKHKFLFPEDATDFEIGRDLADIEDKLKEELLAFDYEVELDYEQ